MNSALLDTVETYVIAHADPDGVASTPIPGLVTIHAKRPSGLVYAINQPLVCLVLQGEKHVTFGQDSVHLRPGDSMLITADIPTVSQITEARADKPYLSLVMNLDLTVIAELMVEMKDSAPTGGSPVHAAATDDEVATTALRLMRLLDRPEAVPILHGPLARELHYWLLSGVHGNAIRRLGWPDGHARRIARAVTLIRDEFARSIPVKRLADVAGMSPSSFHEHFRAATSLTPLQFQKQLRLIEARRLMVTEGESASNAAFDVGYESVSQFTREYGRMFGAPPVRDAANLRAMASETVATV